MRRVFYQINNTHYQEKGSVITQKKGIKLRKLQKKMLILNNLSAGEVSYY
jgi:hypothetical protein